MEQVVIIIIFIVTIASVVYFSKKIEKERSDELAALAQRLGFEFHAEPADDLYHHYREFHLFSRGGSKKIKNLFNDGSAYNLSQLFGYQYTVSTGKSASIIRQTVASFQNHDYIFPDFELRPENIIHKIGQIFGYQDIDFDSNKEFSDKFLLRGKDEKAITKLFSTKLLKHLQSKDGICIEARGNTVIFYEQGTRVAPQEIESFFNSCKETYQLFCQSLSGNSNQ